MAEVKLLSPAKLNLFLHIVGQRDDGYHLLQSVFQLIDRYDEMHFTLLEEDRIQVTCSNNEITESDNIVFKTAKLLLPFRTQNIGIKIHIDKKIPLGGGLGGGSSNAATTLLALNHLWQTNLAQTKLQQLALTLGADVPFFVTGQNAWVEGIGEQIYPIEVPNKYFVVTTPNQHICTQDIFKHPKLTRNTKTIKIRHLNPGMGHNDCQNLVRQLFPAVDEAITLLSQFAPARLSGTGASVFAEFSKLEEANKAYASIKGKLDCFIAQGINQSPVQKWLESPA